MEILLYVISQMVDQFIFLYVTILYFEQYFVRNRVSKRDMLQWQGFNNYSNNFMKKNRNLDKPD